LYKAKQQPPQDKVDLAPALPSMSERRRAWLRRAIETVGPGHAWLDQLIAESD
jgi:hypothetical protein